jgi:hypothetical protein
MTARHILIDDQNPLHRELPIYRTGSVSTIRLADQNYTMYASQEINAHDYTALFYYGVIEALNTLPFISETRNGLDSWDESFLPSCSIAAMTPIIGHCIKTITGKKMERIVLGWQDDPERIAYWRDIDPEKTVTFLRQLRDFAARAAEAGYDLEFIL